jgi:CDP-glycerol glycerophosphotransferase (TagB/SpsB family)
VFLLKELLARLIAGTGLFPDLKDGLWLFIDRDTLADDNAEHFYSFLENRGHPAPRHFVVSATSPDWERLRRRRFRLIKYGSLRMHIACLRSSHLFSSQADAYVARMATLAKKRNTAARYIFLQHGILHHNLSNWLNKRPIDLMVTSTRAERDAVRDCSSGYRLPPDAVLLTGLPRHDTLNQKAAAQRNKDRIILMPTWRKYLSSSPNRTPALQGLHKDSRDAYFQRWSALLSSPDLHAVAERLRCRVVLVQHPRMQAGEDALGKFQHVEIFRWANEGGIQNLLCRCAIAVTDYSSIAFDAALAGADVVYYHFDTAAFFSGAHSCRPGFFDYQRDGLGPVCLNEQQVIVALEQILRRGTGNHQLFEERKRNFFTYRDAGNCERLLAKLATDTGKPT